MENKIGDILSVNGTFIKVTDVRGGYIANFILLENPSLDIHGLIILIGKIPLRKLISEKNIDALRVELTALQKAIYNLSE